MQDRLLDNEVHIWQVNLQVPETKIAELTHILSADEQAKANRFKFAEHRNRFIVARGCLRKTISNYLKISCEEIQFSYSDRGKPELTNYNFYFNVSHSENLALYVFSSQYLVGVDLEFLRNSVETLNIAQRFFSEQEYQIIQSYPQAQQNEVFFRLWTAKEAYLKATGEGLVGGLDNIIFEINNASEIKLLTVKKKQNEVKNWYFYCLIPHQNFVATVAVKNYQNNVIVQKFEF